MEEVELKFQVPAAQRAAVDAAIAGRTPRPRTRMQAAYFDTDARILAGAGQALRLRREGRQWVQTLKAGGADAMTRFEHNVARGGAATMPPLAPALHAGTPVGDALLAQSPDSPLAVRYRTDLLRRTRVLRAPLGRVELAFDLGAIHAAGRRCGVCELEIELLAGAPQAVLDTARRWLPRFGLWLDSRSKAERGDLLARGESMAPARQAQAVRLAPDLDAATARQAVLRSCSDQIIANASQIASGEHGAEHVHQLRVGLRRLRSALKLFEGSVADVSWGEAAAVLFRRLGGARDQVVIDAEFAADLGAAMLSAGVDVTGAAAGAGAPALPTPTAVLRETASQMLLLDLLAAARAPTDTAAPASGTALREQLGRRLNRWHRQVVADARRFTELDDAGRHTLRKRAKRLRYAVEFSAALFERRRVRRYLRLLRALQERLGALSDVVMAMQSFARRGSADPHAMFALGWLAARRERLIADAAPELKAFRRGERFWKRD